MGKNALELALGKIILTLCVQCVYLQVIAWFLFLPQLTLILCYFHTEVLPGPHPHDGSVGTRWETWAGGFRHTLSTSILCPSLQLSSIHIPWLGKVQAPCPALASLVLCP